MCGNARNVPHAAPEAQNRVFLVFPGDFVEEEVLCVCLRDTPLFPLEHLENYT